MAEAVLDHIYKRFGGVTAVKDFNRDIKDEEFMVFVGPSGCSKTTTLRMVAGLEEIATVRCESVTVSSTMFRPKTATSP